MIELILNRDNYVVDGSKEHKELEERRIALYAINEAINTSNETSKNFIESLKRYSDNGELYIGNVGISLEAIHMAFGVNDINAMTINLTFMYIKNRQFDNKKWKFRIVYPNKNIIERVKEYYGPFSSEITPIKFDLETVTNEITKVKNTLIIPPIELESTDYSDIENFISEIMKERK